ncbi:50S ribosomal protein L9 [Demetria terragena]|uniref:50S ribosomal protein L9 n=1 Tax=Demetria terragena TaxID=63959 RepID=UPI00036996A2|nr:50S ribosomal protein L9 [Demetria terragena]
MKVILTHEVARLGTAGDIVDVKDGYARNYLVPRSLATPWTKGGQKQVDAINRAREARSVKSLDDAKALKGTVEAQVINISARAGESGRLFGAVTTAEIATAISEAGAGSVDRRTIQIEQPIRTVGGAEVQVRLHPEVSATVKLNVVRSK